MSEVDAESRNEASPAGEHATDAPEHSPLAALRAAIEAICMVADEPVPSEQLAEVLDVSVDMINEVCVSLTREYEAQGRGFVLANVAGGWRFQSAASQAFNVEKFVLDGQTARMSGAALETLAIIAYKQPISRQQIAAIRGVSVDGVLKTLQQRGYVNEGEQIEGSGQAQFFKTTQLFLEKLGINSLEELPPLGEFFPDAGLVEAMEQGLRPASALDIMEEAEAELSGGEEADLAQLDNAAKDVEGHSVELVEAEQAPEQVIDLRHPAAGAPSTPPPTAEVMEAEEGQEGVVDTDDAGAKKRWWRPGDRS